MNVLGAAQSHADFPVLSALLLVPLAGALLMLLMPRSRPDLFKVVAVLVSVIPGALAVWVFTNFDKGRADELQFTESHDWVSGWGIEWQAGVDGLSLLLVIMTALIFPLALAGVNADHSPRPYYAWMLILEAGCLGAFVALDLIMFFVFFEIVLVPMYFLIGGWGHGQRAYAATKFFLFTMFGSALMLVAIVSLAFLHASATGAELTFSLVDIAEQQALATNTARWLFLAFALAFAVKVPLIGLHTWLPDAHTNAPTAGSVILAAVMLKLGTYGLVRFGLYLFPEATVHFAPVFVTLGVIGIIYGSIVAAVQRDLKRLVAFSSVAHLGFIVIGIFALNSEGLVGGVLQMVNHGVSTGALFLLVGMIYERRQTREISELGGLQRSAPLLAATFAVVMLSSLGLPGLNGFVGELLILLGAFNAWRWWAVVAATGVILAAVYLLWAYQRVFHGPATGDNARMPDLRWHEGALMAPFVVAIVFMGVYPKPFIERVEPAVDAVIAHISEHVDGFAEPVADVHPAAKLDDLEGLTRREGDTAHAEASGNQEVSGDRGVSGDQEANGE